MSAARDPWHGPASIARGIEHARAAIAERRAGLAIWPWLAEVDRLERAMRCATPAYQRFDRHARQLTAEAIRASRDAEAIAELERQLRAARYPGGHSLHGLDRVWTRAELGQLIVEATNRGRQLAAGDAQRPKGPALDPRRIPDDRLELLIQRHRDLAVVDQLRAERRRREAARA